MTIHETDLSPSDAFNKLEVAQLHLCLLDHILLLLLLSYKLPSS